MQRSGFSGFEVNTQTGAIADLSLGWDGSLWALTEAGAPQCYDPVAGGWQAFGDGVDAATVAPAGTFIFRGPEVVVVDAAGAAGTPVPIGTLFPKLPDSFKLGVTGAVTREDGTMLLFKGGWCVPADGSTAPTLLTGIRNWPTQGPWAEGVVDGAWHHPNTPGFFVLTRGGDALMVQFSTNSVLSNPMPIAILLPLFEKMPVEWVTNGIDTVLPHGAGMMVLRGPVTAVVSLDSPEPVMAYLGAAFATWPASWNPILTHAPSGRTGDLWAVAVAVAAPGDVTGPVAHHDGTAWSVLDNTEAASVSMGQDGTVFAANPKQAGRLFAWTAGGGWTQFGQAPQPLVQAATGGAGLIWARGEDGTVYQVDPATQAFTVNANVGAATHIAANPDGTLWHCRANDPHAYCVVPETAEPATGKQVGDSVASVERVASNRFGTAYVLARNTDGGKAAYRYDSPYVFKSVGGHPMQSLVFGNGKLFGWSSTPGVVTNRSVLTAFDAHTGQVVASYHPPGYDHTYSAIVFDPLNNLLYTTVATYTDEDANAVSPGAIMAFDAETLAVRWAYAPSDLAAVEDAIGLSGTSLWFADSAGTVRMIDTRNELSGNTPSVKWSWVPPIPVPSNHASRTVTPPLFHDGRAYAGVWDVSTVDGSGYSTTQVTVASCRLSDGADGIATDIIYSHYSPLGIGAAAGSPPVLGLLPTTDGSEALALVMNAIDGVAARCLDPAKALVTPFFALPTGIIQTGMAYDDGTRAGTGLSGSAIPASARRIWFGDDSGNLWALNTGLIPADGTPHQVQTETLIYTTPVLYKDPQGGLTVLYGIWGTMLQPSLYGYDPMTGDLSSIPTGGSLIGTLVPMVRNGMVYAAGAAATLGGLSQVLGIRVDGLPQALRDFVIEGQMLQDPDPTAPGPLPGQADPDPVPPSRARYQTHVTVVDQQKNPVPTEPLKLWADRATSILVDGVPYAVGPGEDAFAAVKTGVDGGLVIRIGYAKPDGTDTPDMYVSPLRVWASFMDPDERIVINPDHAFHQRIATAHSNADDDDPDKVNLVTTRSYAAVNGAPPGALFTADEQSSGQPANCAKAVGQMHSGVGYGGGGAAHATQTLFGRLMLHAGGRKTASRAVRAGRFDADAGTKYMAYPGQDGAGYFPANIPAPRPVVAAQPTGIVFHKPHMAPPASATCAIVDHTAAQAALDALPPPTLDPPWTQPGATASPRRVGNIFTEFWAWLVHVAAEITDLVVTIADDVMVGIRMVVNGIEQVFKAIIHVIDDIASAIGSFFKMLAKIIEDVIAALSVLFHFGEIMWTQRWLVDQVNEQLQRLPAAITTQIAPAVDVAFEKCETSITNIFDEWRQSIKGGAQISGVRGMGSSQSSAFTVGPPGGTASPHAVQGTYGLQKLKSGAPSATVPGTTLGFDTSPIGDFFTAFFARMSGDGDLAAVTGQFSGDFGNIMHAHSASDFFSSLLLVLLDILETLIEGALAVANALVDGFLAVIADAIEAFTALINAEIEIPVLTWLYETVFHQKLTLLNLIALVAAIAGTVIFRAVAGKYPSAIGQASASEAGTPLPKGLQTVMQIAVGVASIALGTLNAVNDSSPSEPPAVGRAALAVGLFSSALSVPAIYAAAPSSFDWAVYGLGTASLLLGVAGVVTAPSDPDEDAGPVLPVLTSILGAAQLALVIAAFIEDGQTDPAADVGFAAGIVGALPGLVNAAKLGPEPAQVFVSVVDFVGGLVDGALDVVEAFMPADAAMG